MQCVWLAHRSIFIQQDHWACCKLECFYCSYEWWQIRFLVLRFKWVEKWRHFTTNSIGVLNSLYQVYCVMLGSFKCVGNRACNSQSSGKLRTWGVFSAMNTLAAISLLYFHYVQKLQLSVAAWCTPFYLWSCGLGYWFCALWIRCQHWDQGLAGESYSLGSLRLNGSVSGHRELIPNQCANWEGWMLHLHWNVWKAKMLGGCMTT